jgi:hypothetical protein
MTLAEFRTSLQHADPPASLTPALLALWHDGRGDWDKAHATAQDLHDRTGSLVHAYLHRREGDNGNAAYWYRKAGEPAALGSLEAEWRRIVTRLLDATTSARPG